MPQKLRFVWGKIHQVLNVLKPCHPCPPITPSSLTCHGVSVPLPLLQSLQSATNTKDTIDSDASREASTNKPKHSASGKNPTRPALKVVERWKVFSTNVPFCLVIKFQRCIYRVEIFDAVGVWSHLMPSWHWACCQQKNAPPPKKPLIQQSIFILELFSSFLKLDWQEQTEIVDFHWH